MGPGRNFLMKPEKPDLSGVFVVESAAEGWYIHFVSRNRYLLNVAGGRDSLQAGFYGHFEDKDEAFLAATHLNALMGLASAYTGGS